MRRVGQVFLTLVALAVMAFWGYFSVVLLVLRCDEGCSGNQAESWLYPGQFVLVLVGLVLGIAGLSLRFNRRQPAGDRCLVLAFGCFVVWFFWAFNFGL